MLNKEKNYYKNSQGYLVPEELIKPIDKIRDELVKKLHVRAKKLQRELKRFKKDTFSELMAFVDLSYAEYDVKPKASKGNLTFSTFDGSMKITIKVQNHLTFDERLNAAKILIDKCLAKWSKGARPEMKALVERAFRTDKKGTVRTKEILNLKDLNIDDKDWKTAISALLASIQVSGSTKYINFYKKINDEDKWEHVTLDLASI